MLEVNKDIVKHIKFDTPDIRSFWNAKVITTVLPLLTQKGSQYELRNEMEEEAFDFINKMQDNGLELSDPYLESYIYGLIAKIAPESLVDGRPCNVNLLIVQQPNPISLIYPNGTIVLSTGLISCLHSEDELVAVLANEISHFVLDHSVFNVNKKHQPTEKTGILGRTGNCSHRRNRGCRRCKNWILCARSSNSGNGCRHCRNF